MNDRHARFMDNIAERALKVDHADLAIAAD
jgi:hypothetical protein